MQLVMDSLVLCGLVLGGLWMFSLRGSISKDKATLQEQARSKAEAQALAAEQERLYRTRKTLRCLGCDKTFPGPLPETGCPHCNLASFVVIDAERRKAT